MHNEQEIISQTSKWIEKVVVGCNFCPFAAREIKHNRVHYSVVEKSEMEEALEAFMQEVYCLDDNDAIETSIVIFPNEAFNEFEDYLDLLELAEDLLYEQGYEGVYQIASFHPQYQFAGTELEDPSNYTNRSIYPMLHLLRETSIDRALEDFNEPETIPDRNVRYARQKGLAYMKALRDACLKKE